MTLTVTLRLPRRQLDIDVSCELPSQGVTALFGRSGAGKTSLLRCIAGLERPPQARVQFRDEIWQDESRFVPPHRRPIAYVFQEASLFPHLDARGNLEYGLRRVPTAERRISFEQAVELLEIGGLLDHRAHELSGGERQRIAIARALLASPRLLLMDEPLASLDVSARTVILRHLERLHDELAIPILYVSHSLAEVMRLADHLALLDRGRVLADGPITEMLTRLDLPLAHEEGAGSVFMGSIAAHDTTYHLSFVAIAGGQLTLSRKDLPIGHRVRVRIDARDVSLVLEPPQRSSISNVLPATVVGLGNDADPAQVVVSLDIESQRLLARITRRSADQLGIAPGKPVYAQIKSVALMEV
jgi:molybdate transport system ATP-binding protein